MMGRRLFLGLVAGLPFALKGALLGEEKVSYRGMPVEYKPRLEDFEDFIRGKPRYYWIHDGYLMPLMDPGELPEHWALFAEGENGEIRFLERP